MDRFGGYLSLARALGVGRTTVLMWRSRGIPDGVKWRIIKLARERGMRISIKDLATMQIDPPQEAEQ
jgi:hypothetical protein